MSEELQKLRIELENTSKVEKKKVVLNISKYNQKVLDYFEIDIEALFTNEVNRCVDNLYYEYIATEEELQEQRRIIEQLLNDDEDSY